jgi:2-oxo-3-hexenedioate decarboxylase
MTTLAGAIAHELLNARARSSALPPYTSLPHGLSVEEAYDVSAEILKQRRARGERPVGRKIGFTNRNIWPEYGVSAPIWNYVFDTTIRFAAGNTGVQSLKGALEPKIEPEIVFCLRSAPRPGMSEAQLADCIDWIAHGYEIVQSLYPAWKFQGADTVAAFGMHGVLIVGAPRQVRTIAGLNRDMVKEMRGFKVSLFCDGVLRDSGAGANVLDSPLLALKHLVDVLAHQPSHHMLEPGEIITTGTLTAALPILAGETWHTAFTGLDLPGLRVTFA